ncbi:hypothetical protein DBR37_00355 [Herminiimonas sp. KBW02]|uniref:DUF2946 family protein n=1 Tax=Herminiimonas sp. KBW02 TaxID=2153363 RepID=UPI000F5969EB|nr:DUF2946 family protein [Herminiimonas sp. KBW02]RQO38775.1 hypothetical protein DBR37_00355 [Herminiimonas sp. KBW02]
MSRVPNVFLVWLLVVCTIAAALLPPIAHAYLHDHDVEDAYQHVVVELSNGATFSEPATSDEQDSQHEHCPFCMKHHVSGYPAMLSMQLDGDHARMTFVPPLYLSAHSTLFAWLIPSSRAPPSLS